MSFSVAAKEWVKRASRLLSKPLHLPAGRYFLERLLDTLHLAIGQGAASGWDMQSEVKAASRLITGNQPFIIDAGANTGVWSQMILRHHPNAHVIAIEPLPEACKTLRKISSITVIESALSSNCGKTHLHLSHELDVSASLIRRVDSSFADRAYSTIQVSTVTIDSLIPSHQIVHFLKMDLEGSELDALKGASRTLDENRIKFIAFEFGSAHLNARTYFHDFWTFLNPRGFRFFRILPGGSLLPVNEYREDLEYFRGATNYIAQHGT